RQFQLARRIITAQHRPGRRGHSECGGDSRRPLPDRRDVSGDRHLQLPLLRSRLPGRRDARHGHGGAMSARRAVLWGWAIGLAPSVVAAQALCTPPKSSNEAKLLATFAVPLAFSEMGALEAAPAERFRIGLEVYYLPTTDSV